MTWISAVCAGLAFGYLLFAILRPERF
ncbi:K(+)-transporting ATPase subunit F [Nannocystaceae bacterium ST9]